MAAAASAGASSPAAPTLRYGVMLMPLGASPTRTLRITFARETDETCPARSRKGASRRPIPAVYPL